MGLKKEVLHTTSSSLYGCITQYKVYYYHVDLKD